MILHSKSILTLVIAILTTCVFAQTKKSNQFNDAEIAAIAVAANQIDIAYAELAVEKSKNKAIVGFAKTMINDHKAVIGQAVDLVTKLGVKPQENTLSKQLVNDSKDMLENLKSKRTGAFDKAYIENEVAYHKAVIDAVRNVLIPDTENDELKSLLEAVLPALEAHLEHAESVRENFD